MCFKKVYGCIAALLFPSLVSALQINGMLGIAHLAQNDATFNLTTDEVDQLIQTDTKSWEAWSLQLGVGYAFPLSLDLNEGKTADDIQWLTKVTPQINFYILNNADLTGEVYRFEDADDKDAAYTLNVDSTRWMFDTALTIASLRELSLYAMAGLGIAWSDLSLSMYPHEGTDLEPLHFSSGKSAGFAYEMGAGLAYEIDEDLDLVLQYLYTGFSDMEISGQDDVFTLSNSDLEISSQSLLLGFNLSI